MIKQVAIAFTLFCCLPVTRLLAQERFSTTTDHLQLDFEVDGKGRLLQKYFGPKLADGGEQLRPVERWEAYTPAGTNNLFEPAIQVTHADGNPSLELLYINRNTVKTDDNITATTITLRDPKYPFTVLLHVNTYAKEDIFKVWTEISHKEKGAVVLANFASSILHFNAHKYYLTNFHGDWAEEMKMDENELTSGIKILDSKLGTRADMYQMPFYFVSLEEPSTETHGAVMAGTLAWTGNFRFAFEVDELNMLRVISGMNTYASQYKLQPDQNFETPAFIFSYSDNGRAAISHNFHRWGAKYGVIDGDKPRTVLLNNWEATGFDFNEEKLSALFDDAHKLGADLFLLDDGWFGNKYPRNADNAGLGDWQEMKAKLPHGLGYLVKTAEEKKVKFGIWLEPEMVNPASDLYHQHPDWILKLPNRGEDYFRNQLVLDLVNPKVQDFVYGIVDNMMTANPGIAYIKWDCNRMITNAYSPYLKDNQGGLYIEYTRSLYQVLKRIRSKYPHLAIMLCSGGGGRVDYGALPYFTEFWASDNTDPFERVFIQWGYSYFFPSFTVADHVTSWGKQSLKFRTDVAMMGRLGYDINLDKFTGDEWTFSQQAVANYKRLQPVLAHGDLYRLISPYKENRAVLMYVDAAQSKSVLFAYNLHTRFGENFAPVKLQGLDPHRQYRVTEINLKPGEESHLYEHNKIFSGDYLMKAGINVSGNEPLSSKVLEIVTE
ncbi:alpha-galactosidase [[Flexibacter] sp. ATCC 35208]|uniref:alpha-galactosidase n=1 Tax=[Flexibacter] sp. ATCC 35208 TaxID=1936242 RepID=UPI0009D01627|nr:alpha-galactosidase [[Flexibacter] sp. ATCC 35208]OMP78657.1 alpha-galactosidase [[Flexibacter] sp. ATCC 35208]